MEEFLMLNFQMGCRKYLETGLIILYILQFILQTTRQFLLNISFCFEENRRGKCYLCLSIQKPCGNSYSTRFCGLYCCFQKLSVGTIFLKGFKVKGTYLQPICKPSLLGDFSISKTLKILKEKAPNTDYQLLHIHV